MVIEGSLSYFRTSTYVASKIINLVSDAIDAEEVYFVNN
jgi:hypothetical protein